MSKETIWYALKEKGFSDVAVAAIMGNMEAESNCVAYRIQGDFSAGYQKSIAYTSDVDRGVITRNQFIYSGPGGGGYGLCQWTYSTRKAGLYDMAKSRAVSIGDEKLQIDWLVEELNQPEFKSVLNTLLNTFNIRQCSDAFIKKFERPADQSDRACAARAQMGQQFYDEFAGKVEPEPVPTPTPSPEPSPTPDIGRLSEVAIYLRAIADICDEIVKSSM